MSIYEIELITNQMSQLGIFEICQLCYQVIKQVSNRIKDMVKNPTREEKLLLKTIDMCQNKMSWYFIMLAVFNDTEEQKPTSISIVGIIVESKLRKRIKPYNSRFRIDYTLPCSVWYEQFSIDTTIRIMTKLIKASILTISKRDISANTVTFMKQQIPQWEAIKNSYILAADLLKVFDVNPIYNIKSVEMGVKVTNYNN